MLVLFLRASTITGMSAEVRRRIEEDDGCKFIPFIEADLQPLVACYGWRLAVVEVTTQDTKAGGLPTTLDDTGSLPATVPTRLAAATTTLPRRPTAPSGGVLWQARARQASRVVGLL